MPLPCASVSGEHYRTTGHVVACLKIPSGPLVLSADLLRKLNVSGASRGFPAGDVPTGQAFADEGLSNRNLRELSRSGNNGTHGGGVELEPIMPENRTLCHQSGQSTKWHNKTPQHSDPWYLIRNQTRCGVAL